jgi:hypothetical protein
MRRRLLAAIVTTGATSPCPTMSTSKRAVYAGDGPRGDIASNEKCSETCFEATFGASDLLLCASVALEPARPHRCNAHLASALPGSGNTQVNDN